MAGDIHFASVKSLLLCNGGNGSTTYTDSSTYTGRTFLQNAAMTSTNPKFGVSCSNMPGNFSVVVTNHISGDLVLTGDFTLDAWLRTTAPYNGSYGPIVSARENPRSAQNFVLTLITLAGVTSLLFLYGSNSNEVVGGTATNATDGSWHHYALTRSGSTVYLYYDGAHLENASFSSQMGNSSAPVDWGFWQYISANTNGGDGSSGSIKSGAMDCMRITDGVARWTGTGSFTPPTAESDYLAATGGPFPHYIWRRHTGGLLIPGGM